MIPVLNSPPQKEREKLRMEWVEMEHRTQGIRVQFVVPNRFSAQSQGNH